MAIGFFVQHTDREQSSICEIVRHNGSRYKKNIGISIECKYWNPNRQLSAAGEKYPHGVAINNRIKLWTVATERTLIFIDTHDIKIRNGKHFWDIVECEIRGDKYKDEPEKAPIPIEKKYFTDYFEKIFIPRFSDAKKESRIKRFNVILHKVKEYEYTRKIRLEFDDINLLFHRDLLAYMSSLNHSINYFSSVIKIIRQVMRESHDIDRLHDNRECFSASFKAPYRDIMQYFYP